MKVLTVDNDQQMRRLLKLGFKDAGYQVIVASNGEEALDLAAAYSPDLVILELNLPGMNGFELCMQLRESSPVPIIVTSIRDDEEDKIAALDFGANDYIVKPFGMGELLARARAILRRASLNHGLPIAQIFNCDELSIDFVKRLVHVAGNEVHLTPKEYNLLKYMVTNANRLLTNRQLLQLFWGTAKTPGHKLRVHVANLRKKIESDPENPRYILTETRLGYRFKTSNSSRQNPAAS